MKSPKHLYFVGIAGTGMASTAGLMKQAGYNVSGSDQQVYPPMSTLLENLKIPICSPYQVENIEKSSADLYVIGNSLSVKNPEVDYILQKNLPYTSFPALLGETFLKDKTSLVVVGTHGKTTTTSLVAHCLKEAGCDPGYMIGGLPKNLSSGFHFSPSPYFILEGDEYDTAFFDKSSKFLHYRPSYLILNNIEFDHADIFNSLEEIFETFAKVIALVKDPSQIVANGDDKNVVKLLKEMGIYHKVLLTSINPQHKSAKILGAPFSKDSKAIERPMWKTKIQTPYWGTLNLTCPMMGNHNLANLTQTVGLLSLLSQTSEGAQLTPSRTIDALKSFQGVRRRLDIIGSQGDIFLYEDFAHHPTAVKHVIQSYKKNYPERRLLIAFEPKNATSRRNIFTSQYGEAFALADLVALASPLDDRRVAPEDKMDIKKIAEALPNKAFCFETHGLIKKWLVDNLKPKDTVIFMSCGSFSNIAQTTLTSLTNQV